MKKIIFVLMAFCLLTATAHAQDTIKIGLMAPLTGSFASEGAEMKQVLELLVAEQNAKGGLLGKKIELIVDDDGSDARTAALAAQRLTTKGVVAVIGTYGSSVTEASQNIFNEAKIIQVANGSTAIRLTEKNLKYFFRTCPRDDEQGKVAVDAIVKTKAKKVAILHDNSTYAKGLADEVKPQLEKKGIKVVFFDALTPKQSDYTAVLTKMKGARPGSRLLHRLLQRGGASAEAGQADELEGPLPGRRCHLQYRPGEAGRQRGGYGLLLRHAPAAQISALEAGEILPG